MKKSCVISANCQGAYIKALLEAHPVFSKDFEVRYFVNYQNEEVSQNLLEKCSLLIYQPLGDKWGTNSEKYLNDNIPKSCITIRVNYLTFPVYWPFQTQDSRNTTTASFPFGQFPYGDKFVLDLMAQGMSNDDVLRLVYDREAFTKKVELDAVISNYISHQRDIESRRDQKLLDYIMDNYKSVKLFETFNHPSRPLCIYQVNEILNQLGYASLGSEAPPLSYLKENQQPIHPYVSELLKLEFSSDWTGKYNIWGKPLSVKEYYEAYINWDTNAIGVPVKKNCEQKRDDRKKSTGKSTMVAMRNNIINKDLNEQLLFLHIPKTAGTSLNQMLAEATTGVNHFKHYNSTITLIKDKGRRKHPVIMGHVHYDVYKTLSNNCKIFTFLRDPIDRTISAFEFMKSHPETWLGQLAQGSIEDFLQHNFVKKSIADIQTRLLGVEIKFQKLYVDLRNNRITEAQYYDVISEATHAEVSDIELNRAKERLRTMFFVGFTESFSQDSEALFAALGLPCPQHRQANQTPVKFKKRDKYTESDIELIKKLNKNDINLYNFARELFKR